MTVSKFVRLAAIAAFAIVASAGAAFAATTAYTKGFSNVRGGREPASRSSSLCPKTPRSPSRAARPPVGASSPRAPRGFIKKNLLKPKATGPDLPFDFSVIIGPDIVLSLGDDEEPEEDEVLEVCFYQGEDFTDANFCVEPGDSDEQIPGSFNNNIESITVSDGLIVTVCSGVDFGGTCEEHDEDQDALPASLSDRITSYSVDE